MKLNATCVGAQLLLLLFSFSSVGIISTYVLYPYTCFFSIVVFLYKLSLLVNNINSSITHSDERSKHRDVCNMIHKLYVLIIPTTLVCLLFNTAIPTSLFYNYFYTYMHNIYIYMYVYRVLPTLVGGGRSQPHLSLFYHYSSSFNHLSQ